MGSGVGFFGAGGRGEKEPLLEREINGLLVDIKCGLEEIGRPIQKDLEKNENKHKFYSNSVLDESDIPQYYTQLPERLVGAVDRKGRAGWAMERPWLNNAKINQRCNGSFDLKYAIASCETFQMQGIEEVPGKGFYVINKALEKDQEGNVWPVLAFLDDPYIFLPILIKQAKREIVLSSSQPNYVTQFASQKISENIFSDRDTLALKGALKVEINAVVKQYVKQCHKEGEEEQAKLQAEAKKQSKSACFPGCSIM